MKSRSQGNIFPGFGKTKQNRTSCQSRTIYPAKLSRQSVEIIKHKLKKEEHEIRLCLPLINTYWKNSQRMYFVEKDTESRRKDWVIKKKIGTKVGTLPIYLALSSFLESAIFLPGERFLKDILSFEQPKPRDRFFTQLISSTVLGLPVWGTQAWCSRGHQFHSDYTTGVFCQRTGNVQVFPVPDAVWGMTQSYPKESALSWGSFLQWVHAQKGTNSLKGEW